MASADRQCKLVERTAETFEQERAAHGIVSQQSHASFPACESQDGDLVLGRVTATRHDELQHGRGAVGAGRLRDESLCRVAIGVADRDGPSSGRSSSHPPAPTASAFWRTTSGTWIMRHSVTATFLICAGGGSR